MKMKTIDGSMGEGGGQILRTSLSLSGMMCEPVCIENIRANRGKPGLKRQHLTAVRAMAEICNARLEGAELNASELTFEPSEIRGGNYHFAIGSAGSVVLVAQTIIPVLLMAKEHSTVVIEGGTHVQGAPIFEFFDEVFLPQLRRMGCEVTATLERYGFFPAGGGAIRLEIEPIKESKRYSMLESGKLESAEIVVLYSGLDRKIAEAEADIIAHQVQDINPVVTIREVDTICSGNAVYLKLKFEHITEMFSSIGAINRSRREVAQKVVKLYKNYKEVGQPIGAFLADQLLLPMYHFSSYGSFCSCPWSLHSKTNLKTLQSFRNHREHVTRPVQNGIEFAVNDECNVFFRPCQPQETQDDSPDIENETPTENTNEMD